MKYAAWFCWTIVSLFIFLSFSSMFGADVEHLGHDLVFTTSSARYLEIEDEDEVVLEAASEDFFAFHQESGEIVAGRFGQPPLGWEYKTYYFIDPTQIQPGKWSVEGDSSIYIHLSNNDGFIVKEIYASLSGPDLGAFILALFIWAAGSLIGAIYFDGV